MLKSWRELEEEKRRDDCNGYSALGGGHHLAQSAVKEDILASNLFEMGTSSCQQHISQEHFANKNLHLDALPGVLADFVTLRFRFPLTQVRSG